MIEEFDEIEKIRSNEVVSKLSVDEGIIGIIRFRFSDAIKEINYNVKTFN